MKNPFESFRNYPLSIPGTASFKRQVHEKSDLSHLAIFFEEISNNELMVFGLALNNPWIETVYHKILNRLDKFDLSAGTIEEFANLLMVKHMQGHGRAVLIGLFLSALINNSSKKRFFVEIPSTSPPIHFLGYHFPEGKTLEIYGNTGDFLGTSLSGGHVYVHGNVRDWAALGMKSGKILIKGSCGRFACEWMRGGDFLVEGKIENTGKVVNGNIVEHYSEK